MRIRHWVTLLLMGLINAGCSADSVSLLADFHRLPFWIAALIAVVSFIFGWVMVGVALCVVNLVSDRYIDLGDVWWTMRAGFPWLAAASFLYFGILWVFGGWGREDFKFWIGIIASVVGIVGGLIGIQKAYGSRQKRRNDGR